MRFMKLSIAAVLAATSFGAWAGSVSSMSSERVVSGPEGKNYLQSSVNCASGSLSPNIRRPEEGGEWCGAEVPGFCSRNKISAAKKVCGRAYLQKLKETPTPAAENVSAEQGSAPREDIPPPAEQAPAVEPQQVEAAPSPAQTEAGKTTVEQLEMERERLRIEQQRLELRKQQVELQKQELEIKRQMENHDKATKAAAPQKPAPSQPDDGLSPNKNVLGM